MLVNFHFGVCIAHTSPSIALTSPMPGPYKAHYIGQHNTTSHILYQVCGVCAMLLHGSTSPFPAIPLLTSAHHCKNFASIIFLWCSPSLAHTQPIHNSNSASLTQLVYPCQRNGPGIPNKCNIPLCTVQINFLFLIFFCKFLIIN